MHPVQLRHLVGLEDELRAGEDPDDALPGGGGGMGMGGQLLKAAATV